MIVERSMHPDWLSNTYLVAAAPGGDGFVVDAGGPVRPLVAAADEPGNTVTHAPLTHPHGGPGAERGPLTRRWSAGAVLIPPAGRDRGDGATGDLEPGAVLD